MDPKETVAQIERAEVYLKEAFAILDAIEDEDTNHPDASLAFGKVVNRIRGWLDYN